MAPVYKLTYFDYRSLAEPIRLLFAYGGVEYEDIRFQQDQWPDIKPTTPYGKSPTLEIDGKVAHQSAAICRYLARQFGLCGSNEWESLQIDMLVDTFCDFRNHMVSFAYEEDEVFKAKKREPVLTQVLPFHLSKFDKTVADNGGYFVGGKLTWADIYWVGIVEYMSYMVGHDLTADYKNLKQLEVTVLAVPSIKAWVEIRPKNEY